MDLAELNNALNLKGFLSPSMELVKENFRAIYAKSFEGAESASDLAQRSMMAADFDQQEPHMLAALVFLHRTIRSCQAAVILCERGLVIDAQTVTRSAAETLFHGIALINDPSVFSRMSRQCDMDEKKQAKAMIDSLSDKGLTEQNIADLTEVIRRGDGNGPGFSTHDAARVAGLMHIYDTLYRGLSVAASHATFRSMDSSFHITDDQVGLITGPTDQHLEFTLDLVQSCLDIARKGLDENFGFQ
ncbi:hypothetical protein FBY06_1441 [Pseudomonas sp. SJZ085]|uniref:DUF5677 domain-containing protein n=1 Tax=unclassified Pseudomonas TaxID=196821 RepID=UPI00119B0AA8|nr:MULTISPECIES: DUF5677 domain-containing protein [unclassified Pseudomonas]TWC11412.1 hypothetical protein FBX99_1441 [Pseudomonas sp. SJZ074]TWC30014.1 hypothetical protein FBY06_1441 [Pseudomonas sp. SJZ085]